MTERTQMVSIRQSHILPDFISIQMLLVFSDSLYSI